MNGVFSKGLVTHSNHLNHIFTSRTDSMLGNNFGFNTPDAVENVSQNRNTLKKYLHANYLIFPTQTHSSTIHCIDKLNLNSENELIGDALITNLTKVAISVTTADCVPLLIFDAENKVIAAVHAGLKGTLEEITLKTISLMCEKYNCDAKNIFVAIGPCISKSNYEIGADVWETLQFTKFEKYLLPHQNTEKRYFDLVESNINQLLEAGVLKENIENIGICTFDHEASFFSYRKNKSTGRMASALVLI